jgi:hypothetical protein
MTSDGQTRIYGPDQLYFVRCVRTGK